MAGYDERDAAMDGEMARVGRVATKAGRDIGLGLMEGQETPPGLRREVISLRGTADALEKVIEQYSVRLEPLFHYMPTDSYGSVHEQVKESTGESEMVASFQHETARINDGLNRLRDILDRIQL